MTPTNITNNLHPCLRKDPAQEVKRLERDALVWKTLGAISFVAFVAIMGVALACGAGLMTLSAKIVIPLVLSTVLFEAAAIVCTEKQKETLLLAREALKIQLQFQEVSRWEDNEVAAFYKDLKINRPDPETFRLNTIKLIIAHYNRFLTEGNKQLAEANKDLKGTATDDPDALLNQRRSAWFVIENQALPNILKATRILEILHNPTSQLPIDPPNLVIKAYDQRQFDVKYTSPSNNAYVTDPEPIDFKTIYENPDPTYISKLMFPAPTPT